MCYSRKPPRANDVARVRRIDPRSHAKLEAMVEYRTQANRAVAAGRAAWSLTVVSIV